ncbi:type II toxin-antitoxin system PemK/MazF family toxin [Mucilaginibacter roseus]|uniref:Type II toxin-antitoxin system PemK/MazF family toxin n=1 Tax=Mucilaginibacter roseus TaxID=1528868 RepID=A0ABS8U342_9SPHI|nr:type II toxin-antitoxin system PemK/MazF family toxin [Mucilaginibacter roseus]MCD8741551.1 type II toxin-antitoxin system PemK/MazF family toxin [Mucilaginibacter roseus]
MAGFVKGDVVVIPFPFSDLSGSKRRPALVLADLPGDDIILCQITSQQAWDSFAVPIDASSFLSGSLPVASNVRPSRIFTADKNIILKKAGTLNQSAYNKVVSIINSLIS